MNDRTITQYIAVHCSATQPDEDIGEDEIRRWHKAKEWSDIGYNIVIRRSGQVEVGRPLDYPGAHVAGFNSRSLGICLVGGIDHLGAPENNFTPEQMASLEETIRWLDLVYPDTIVQGHRDFSPDLDGDGVISEEEWLKECPCFDVRAWTRQVGLR